ncbi:hypothetical protein XM53_16015 [Roseovarius atlanticus]|uniref:DUF3306 domain-containing protein n=1 Tax=Roseovarius atlanticus TaxID=1641875 RepID=A0A0T5NR95_9RHOB|nr:DUF3306 domain-containing protein [Roseovarius atlanticus]KRS11453.1 hypothetical protein XM53_16015 [Roseovarius atlanticus]
MSAREDFWSRRKARVAAEDAAKAEAREEAQRAEARASLEEKSDAEVLELLGLPDPDTMNRGDDFSAFMAEAVPDRIRRWALRRLWGTNPALANLDGLLDYGEDFTDKAMVIENMQTAYQVGKGMLTHVQKLAREAEALTAMADTEGEGDTDAPEPDVDEAVEDADPLELAEAAPVYTYEVAAQEEDAYAPPPRRRMQFTFDDTAEPGT